MKIRKEFDYSKHYIEILPSVSFNWYNSWEIYIGWLFWYIVIEL